MEKQFVSLELDREISELSEKRSSIILQNEERLAKIGKKKKNEQDLLDD